jgi:hypothetical protein
MKIGDKVKGVSYDANFDEIMVEGIYEFITDDPEDYSHDIGIRTSDGRLVYCEEGDVWPVKA